METTTVTEEFNSRLAKWSSQEDAHLIAAKKDAGEDVELFVKKFNTQNPQRRSMSAIYHRLFWLNQNSSATFIREFNRLRRVEAKTIKSSKRKYKSARIPSGYTTSSKITKLIGRSKTWIYNRMKSGQLQAVAVNDRVRVYNTKQAQELSAKEWAIDAGPLFAAVATESVKPQILPSNGEQSDNIQFVKRVLEMEKQGSLSEEETAKALRVLLKSK